MADNNSNNSSPYASSTEDFEETMDRGLRRRTSRTGRRNLGGMDLDDVEDAVRSMQQDTQDIRTEFTGIRNQSQSQKRRILDLENQFEEARVRIDKLLQRKSMRRGTYDSSSASSMISPTSSSISSHHSSSMYMDSSDGSDTSSAPETHKTQININPSNAKQTFGTVTLTVKVDEDSSA